MDFRQLRTSRQSITVAVALVGLVSLAIGAHAALNKRSLDAAKAIATGQSSDAPARTSRLALVIGNGHYPDAAAPLAQPINDARDLSAALRGAGFDVDVVEDATKDDMNRATSRLKAKIKGAVRTDFILSAEIIVIALGTVATAPIGQRLAVLVGIASLITVGVYGLVAGIVKLDDAGLYLSRGCDELWRAVEAPLEPVQHEPARERPAAHQNARARVGRAAEPGGRKRVVRRGPADDHRAAQHDSVVSRLLHAGD